MQDKAGKARGLDLYRVRAVQRLVRWPGMPYVVQAAMLAALVWLAWLGSAWMTPKGVPDKLYAKTNLVNLAVWGIFWPSIVWTTVLFGRVWCAVCPLELVSNSFERLGRGFGIPQRALPKWMRAGWLMVLLYATLQMLVAGMHLHRVPAYTSVFLWGMVAIAAGTGLFLRDRGYCRGVCPIAPLLKIYGRGGMLAIRAESAERCAQCKEKMCASPLLRGGLDGRSCPSLLNPAKLRDSEDCLLCTQCLKSCEPGNLQLLARAPFEASDRRQELATWPVVLFAMMLSGFVSSEVASEWPAAKAVFLAPVEWAVKTFGWKAQAGWVEGVWTIAVYPALLWTVLGLIALATRGAASPGEAMRRMALPLTLVVAAGHMAKGLAKFVSWVGFFPLAWDAPDGVAAAAAMAAKQMAQPASLMTLGTVSMVGCLLVGGSLWLAMRESRLAGAKVRMPVAALACLFGFTIFGWGFLQ